MSNKPVTMLQIRRILQLKLQGKSNREIALDLHISRVTVNGYVKRIDELEKNIEQLLKVSDEELSSLVHRELSIVQQDWRNVDIQNRLSYLGDELQKNKATRMILWEEYRQQVPDGYGYTQFCEHLNRFLETRKAVMHFEHEPAACMMFDFAGDKIPLVDRNSGEIIKLPVFVCTLPFSGYTYIEALFSANREQLLKALNNALSYYGGVPRSAKTDNMKQIVKKSNRYEPAFDELAEQWSLHYNTTLMAARVRKPRDKASVESHVNAVYNRIYAPLRNDVFYSIEQMNQSLWAQLDKFNDRNFQRCDYSRRGRFTLHEKVLLLPLPMQAFVPKSKIIAKVQRNCHITLGQDWHHYSVPYQYIGKKMQVVYDTDNVEIYLDTLRITCYKRDYRKNGYTTMDDHMPPAHKHYARMKGWNSEYFTEKASQVGENTVAAIQKILEQKIFIEQTYNSCLGVLRLGEKYGNDRLEAACKRALAGYKVNFTIIKNILERNMDKATSQIDLFFNIPDHENIRGSDSYK
jgi:transposase